MTEAEQIAFFDKFGSQLEKLILDKFNTVDNRLARLEFFSQINRPLFSIGLTIKLDQSYTYDEIGPYRLLIEVADEHEVNSTRLILGSRTWIVSFEEKGKQFSVPCIQIFAKTINPEFTLYEAEILYKSSSESEFDFFMRVKAAPAFSNLLDFDRKSVRLYITESLATKISNIQFIVNRYIIGAVSKDCLLFISKDDFAPVYRLPKWPASPESVEKILSLVDPYVMVTQKGDIEISYPRAMKVGNDLFELWRIDFNKFTPILWDGTQDIDEP